MCTYVTLISMMDETLVFFFGCFFFSGSTNSFHTMSDQKGPRRTASVLSPLRVCWEIIWHLGAKWWLDGEGEKKAENDGSEKGKRDGGVGVGVGGQSIQHPCLYHVITCQHKFKNKAFERPSRATVRSILWKCLPRPHWRVSWGYIKHDPPLREPVTHTRLSSCVHLNRP